PGGRGLVVELPGADPLPEAPTLPERESSLETALSGAEKVDPASVEEPFPVTTYTIELHLYPAVEGGRAGVFSSTLAIPGGCQTRATLSSPNTHSVIGISPSGAMPAVSNVTSKALGRTVILPGPAQQLVFYWSAGDRPFVRTPADVQVGISCLVD